MRILLVLGKLYERTVEGTQKSVINLANELADRENEVYILTRRNHRHLGRPEALSEDVEIVRREFSKSNFFNLRKTVNKISPDIINPHTTSWKMAALSNGLSLFQDSETLITLPTWKEETRIERLLMNFSAKSGVTETVSHKHITEFVTPYGVDSEKYSMKEDFDGKLEVMFAGNPKKDRGFEDACKALSKVEGSFRFNVAVADELGKKEIAELKLEEFGLKDKSKIVGYQEDMPRFLKKQDVNINLIPTCEGITAPPILTLESMMTGVIPVCSDIQEFTDLIENGENGFTHGKSDYKAIASSIESLIEKNDAELSEMAKKARNSAREKHSKEESAKIFEKAYREVT